VVRTDPAGGAAGLEMTDGSCGANPRRQTYWLSPETGMETQASPEALLCRCTTNTHRLQGPQRAGPGTAIERLISMGNALTSVLVLDGRIAAPGTVIGKGRVEITARRFEKPRKAQKAALEAAAGSYAAFSACP